MASHHKNCALFFDSIQSVLVYLSHHNETLTVRCGTGSGAAAYTGKSLLYKFGTYGWH